MRTKAGMIARRGVYLSAGDDASEGYPGSGETTVDSARGLNDGQQALLRDMRRMGLAIDDMVGELSRKYGLRPREAYRIARGLSVQEAVARFNGYLARSEPAAEGRLTDEELRRYEAAHDGGSVPSLATLDLLAQVYDTEARNLVDFDDRVNLSVRERVLLDRDIHGGGQAGQSISASVIGQATAILALAVAVIYAAGDLDLGFKLWFLRDTWAPVLSGLPTNLVLVSAVNDGIPALIAAMPVYYAYYLFRASKYRPVPAGKPSQVVLAVVFVLTSSAVLAAVPALFTIATRSYFYAGVLRPWKEIFLACFLINIVVVGLARLALWLVDTLIHGKILRHVLAVGAVALALIPCVASVYATYPLPKVVLCGPEFSVYENGHRYMEGNLIGDSGQWAYVAETRQNDGKEFGAYISVVPLSAVNLETIGSPAECNNLEN